MNPPYEVTYDYAIAAAAEKELPQGKRIRRFQKSNSDGKGDRYTIRRDNFKVTDITADFDPIFG